MPDISLKVNGKDAKGSVEGRTLLSSFLRDQLKLTGTHVGCDTSQCGACVVHVNGQAVKACTMFAAEADGADVTTIEGMSNPDGSLSVVQQAFQDHHGLQCGFCTPGILMSLTECLHSHPEPSEEQIRDVLSGHLCRCTGYQNIVAAALDAAAQLRKAKA